MKKQLLHLLALLFVTISSAQNVCNPSGDLIIYTNYDGGNITINVDQNIPNLKIGICSYEACNITLTGAFVNNVVAVRYAGYNGANNNSCSGGAISTTSINGAPGTATTSIVFAPASPVSNSNGYGSIICGYSCSNNTNQGGCNTVDQVEGYFLNYFSGSVLFAHKVQYGCWSGTYSVSAGGTCCPPVPVYSGSVSASQTICAGTTPSALTSVLSASSSAGTITYTWQSSTTSSSSGFTNISGANAAGYSPSSLSSTTYFRRAASTATNNTVYSNVVTVMVNPLPFITVSSPQNPVCSGSSASVSAFGAPSITWQPSGYVGPVLYLSPSFNTTVTAIGTSAAGCSNSAVYVVTVNPLPFISALSSSQTICYNDQTTLVGSGALSYAWQPGTLAGATVVVSPTAATVYTVTGTDANGCSNAAQVAVNVDPLPLITVTDSYSVACIGDPLSMTAGGATNYTWLPAGTVNSVLTITPSSTVTYTVVGFDGTCYGSVIHNVLAVPPPTVTASASRTIVCKLETLIISASGANSYSWNSGQNTSSISVSLLVNTTFSVIGTSTSGCSASASFSIKVVNCFDGLEENIMNSHFEIFPNPNSGEFVLAGDAEGAFNLTNATGQLVRSFMLRQSEGYKTTITSLPAGIYFISSGTGRKYQNKIVVLK